MKIKLDVKEKKNKVLQFDQYQNIISRVEVLEKDRHKIEKAVVKNPAPSTITPIKQLNLPIISEESLFDKYLIEDEDNGTPDSLTIIIIHRSPYEFVIRRYRKNNIRLNTSRILRTWRFFSFCKLFLLILRVFRCFLLLLLGENQLAYELWLNETAPANEINLMENLEEAINFIVYLAINSDSEAKEFDEVRAISVIHFLRTIKTPTGQFEPNNERLMEYIDKRGEEYHNSKQ